MNQAQEIMSSTFDISNLDDSVVEQVTHDVTVITDLDGESLTGFRIVGKNSPEYQTASNAIRIENIQRSAKRKNQVDTSTEEGATVVANTIARTERTIALAVTVGWFGFTANKEPIEFSKALVEKMFNKYPQWQVMVNAALENDANFMKV